MPEVYPFIHWNDLHTNFHSYIDPGGITSITKELIDFMTIRKFI